MAKQELPLLMMRYVDYTLEEIFIQMTTDEKEVS